MIWFVFLFVLQIADIVTTLMILKQGGRELNPIMAKFMQAVGPEYALISTKSLLLLGVFLSESVLAMQVLCAIYCIVIAFNFRSLK